MMTVVAVKMMKRITMAATFSLSLSSSDEPLDESMSVSQSPTMYGFPLFFFLWKSFFLPSLFLYGLFFFFSSSSSLLESSFLPLYLFLYLSFLGFVH